MNRTIKVICRTITHAIFGARRFQNRFLKKFAKGIKDKKILEIGSGRKIRGKYVYSVKRFFDMSNEFIMSDINQMYGHKVVDITKMDFKESFDLILCLNVLEHIYDFKMGIDNIHKALKKDGTAVISLPVFYPFHDIPNDYWRFTEYSLVKLFSNFKSIKIKHKGLRAMPIMYIVILHK